MVYTTVLPPPVVSREDDEMEGANSVRISLLRSAFVRGRTSFWAPGLHTFRDVVRACRIQDIRQSLITWMKERRDVSIWLVP